jgi:hypothetical protein
MSIHWRVAWRMSKGAETETHEDFATPAAAATRAESLTREGRDVVMYRIDLEETA